MTGFIVTAVIAIIVLLIGFKIGPPYMEYMSIKKQFKALAEDPGLQNASPNTIGGHFNMRAAVENIRSVGPADLDIEKDGDKLVISAQYTVCVPIIANIRACMDFKPSSAE